MINLFLPNKTTFIFIAILLVIIFILTFVSLLFSPSQPTPQATPSPFINPSQTTINNLPEASISSLTEPSPETVYSPEVLEQDYQRLNANIPLTTSDSDIRNRLITSLNNQSGTLSQTQNYNISYIKTRDIFLVEITSTNANQAKSEALNWFFSQGLSTQGICNLPVSIYLSLTIKQSLAGENETFNPMPEGCQ
jgi:hypothetical protein